MFEMKAIVLPSGDHAVPPITRVIYIFSISNVRSTAAFDLEDICLGSVITAGAGEDVDAGIEINCAEERVLIKVTIAIRARVRISDDHKSCAFLCTSTVL